MIDIPLKTKPNLYKSWGIFQKEQIIIVNKKVIDVWNIL